ncbi:MAG: ATPase, T2SS/T4P/T4SS family [Sporomusaceae bacterium]|nr:ATPase, T2SS/T4P/T4SS family [Sporomusaceae bacterium]
MVIQRKRLGDLMIETGIISQEQLNKALGVQKVSGERLGRIFLDLGYITEERMVEVLEFQLGVPHIELAQIEIQPEVLKKVPVAIAEKYKVFPVKQDGRFLMLAMTDPTNLYAIDDVRMAAECEVTPVIATERDVLRAISKYYGVNELVEKAVSRLRIEETPTAELQTADDAPIIGIVNSLFLQAVRERASDIHIEPQGENLRVRFRVDGVLREVCCFTANIQAAIISRIKIMAGMDIAEKRLPQDGRIFLNELGPTVDIRVSSLPTIYGEKMVMRILDQRAVVLDMEKLGFSSGNLTRYRRLYQHAYGMILVTGPTGSGKTTTLYSSLEELNDLQQNIVTLEDPVEYRLAGINQVQVNARAGLHFSTGLRSILRQDPNIIMVGEIRDNETADIAVRAALTGHLVMSTLHTNDAPSTITRLIDMGVPPFLVASSILGIVAQRLVRLLCPHCKKPYQLKPDSPERFFLGLDASEPVTLYQAQGCTECSSTGYRGRISIHEVMVINEEIRTLISQSASTDQIRSAATANGMTSMLDDGIQKILQGLTTVKEVMRVSQG